MSSGTALIMLAAAVAAPPPLTAEQAMANYRAMLHGTTTDAPRADCTERRDGDIVVCAHRERPSPRLPLPEARAEAGEVVHHLGEPPKGDPGAPTGPPSRQMDTVKALFGLLRGAVTGEDPNP